MVCPQINLNIRQVYKVCNMNKDNARMSVYDNPLRPTKIQILVGTWYRLRKYQELGESWDDVINKIIDEIEVSKNGD